MASANYSDITGRVIGHWSGGGGGGPMPGAAIVRGPFSFAFDTPGLTDGVAIWTPLANDVLLDAWIEVDTVWNGLSPLADIGTGVDTVNGLWEAASQNNDLSTSADAEDAGTGYLAQGANPGNKSLQSAAMWDQARVVPGRFTAAQPLLLWVSQNAEKGGPDPGATQGAARLYIVTATPPA